MRTSWRAALVVVAVVAAGCGNTSAGDDGDGGGWRAKLPSGTVGAGAGVDAGGSAATMRAEAAADSAVAPMIAPYQPIEYRVAASAKAPATSAEAYQLKFVKGDIPARVAKALGVDASDVDDARGYGDWYYSGDAPDAAVSSSVSSVAVDCPPDVKCDAPREPEPLEGVPSADEARAKATSVLEALGIDVADDDDLVVDGQDGQFRSVRHQPRVDGVPVPMLETSITFGAHGKVQYANGYLFDTDKVGRYPLVSLQEAFDRYQNGFGGGVAVAEPAIDAGCAADGPNCGRAEPGVAVDPVAPTEPAGGGATSPGSSGSGSAGSTGSDPGSATTGEPGGVADPAAPSGPDPEPEPKIVEIKGARLVLEPVATGCLDDPIYLVPAFELLLLETSNDTIGSVTAVADEALDTADPSSTTDQTRVCPEDEVRDTPAGKPEPAPAPDAVEPQPAPARP